MLNVTFVPITIYYCSLGADGVKRAHAEQWNDIVKGVSGEKILEDAKKIRKALKRKEKSKAKSADEWKERLDKVREQKNAKQEKRAKNLAIRAGKAPVENDDNDDSVVNGAKRKRGRFNEDRGKPLGVGFEGKKTNFLNSKTTDAS